MIGRTNTGGGASLNFKVVGGTSTPASPKENTIWVNTDTEITSWHFGADEPNVCQTTVPDSGDPWFLSISHTLHEGDILNFTIPATVSSTFEAIRIYDGSGKLYFVRAFGGAAVTGWSAGTKVGLVISNTSYPIGNWGSDGGSACLYKWGYYYHNEGTVWIQTGATSPVEFNALKKNGITVYPLSAKQYVGGAWVAKGSSSYQNGAWKSTEYIIVPNTDATWTTSKGTASANKTTSGTTVNVTTKASANGTATDSGIYTEFDATQYSTFYIKGSYTFNNTTTSSQVYKIQLLNSSGSAISTIVNKTVSKQTNNGTVNFEQSIDLTSVSGKCKLAFSATTYTTESLTIPATITSCKAY